MRRFLPPPQLGRRIQWLFLLMSLINVVTALPRILNTPAATAGERAAAAAAIVSLVCWWVRGYRRQHVPAWGMPLEALALFAISYGLHDHVGTLGLLFSSMSFRGLFGTWRQVAAFVVTGYAGTVSAVALTDSAHVGGFLVQSIGVPALAIFTSLVATSTRRQEASAAREQIFASVGTILATTAEADSIYRLAAEASRQMLGNDPYAWAAAHLPDGTTAALYGATDRDPGQHGETMQIPLETDKRAYGSLTVHGTRAHVREATDSLHALAAQTVLGLVGADHAASLRHRAFHDGLTGLANRSLLHEHLDRAFERAKRGAPLAVVLLDLDGFKAVNDTLGHATGDLLLATVAQRLREAVRGSDTPARLGGDEFAVVLDGMDSANDALAVAERILTTIQSPLAVGADDITPRASIGVAVFANHGTAEELLHDADTAMYAAKRAGKGCVARLDPQGTPLISTPASRTVRV